MADTSFISWPFFEERHREHFKALSDWCRSNNAELHHESADVDVDCRRLVRLLGSAGWLRDAVPAAYGGTSPTLDVRTLCLTRMTLGYHSGLADFAFAMQGLGTGAISLFGSEAVKQAYLPKVATGEMIAGFALFIGTVLVAIAVARMASRDQAKLDLYIDRVESSNRVTPM